MPSRQRPLLSLALPHRGLPLLCGDGVGVDLLERGRRAPNEPRPVLGQLGKGRPLEVDGLEQGQLPDLFEDRRRVLERIRAQPELLQKMSNYYIFFLRYGKKGVCDIWEKWGWREREKDFELNFEIWQNGVCDIWEKWAWRGPRVEREGGTRRCVRSSRRARACGAR